jgi:glyoxylase-like metal-dependent hydrolase (beta-lactamase superfamily II)
LFSTEKKATNDILIKENMFHRPKAMQTQMFTVGLFSTNCYVVGCKQTQIAVVIDPGFDKASETEKALDHIDRNYAELKYVINTHGHPDHTFGNSLVKNKFNAKIVIHQNDAHLLEDLNNEIGQILGLRNVSPSPDILLRDGDTIEFGKETLKVIETPGHTRGGICLIGKKEIFTGDTLFMGSIGRTDFPESSQEEMKRSLKKLKTLQDSLTVYPGHGSSTILGEEKHCNPFLKELP